jgi:hypothetical protein
MKTRAAVLRDDGTPRGINAGYQDLMVGKNVRGVVVHQQ